MRDERGEWPSEELPKSWRWVPFEQFFNDVTDSSRKLQQKAYGAAGLFPVIDQGEEFIGGYTDDRTLVHLQEPPLIVFGDHTRCVKYVDFRFVQGADGVKVLKAKSYIDPRFAYMALRAIVLPDKGYSRHMKFLRNSCFPMCPIEECDGPGSLDSFRGGIS
jgi:type I restriction enzyme S subunit